MEGVIVLGVDSQIGLTVVRELGEHGVPVYGIGKTPQAVGLYSRYLRKGYIHAARDDRLLALMREIARVEGARFVMTISEGDIRFLNRHRDALPELRLLIPERAAIEFVIDKARVYSLATQLGLQVPRMVRIGDAGTVTGEHGVRYPVVLKWADPARITGALREHRLPLLKCEYCHSREELDAALARYHCIGEYPLVQDYCPGYGLGHMILMYEGEPVLRFQHRRVHEWPPEGGYSTLCESMPADAHADLMHRSVQLLRAIRWQGPAMVEYRYDPQTRNAVLMEINGRFWGSLPLAYHAGARFAWLLYQVIGRGERVPPADAYQAGVRCKFFLPDTKRLFRILFQPDRIQDKSLRFNRWRELREFVTYPLRPTSRYYIFTRHDPMPWLYEMRTLLRRLVPVRSSSGPNRSVKHHDVGR